MPFDSTCKDCFHHGDSDGVSGQCRALPPSYDESPPSATVVTIYAPAKVMTYIRTADDEHACGLFRPLVEPEAPPPETKAERIERLCKGGNVDLIEMKRAIDGR
jgi:phenylpropionate dioxygenase-like ring-hydroxylating dioxygenase large terminal subunit